MKQKQTHGGARPGAGRKPNEKKKMQVFLWVEEEQVNKVGGHDEAKIIGERAIQRAAKK